MLDYRPGLAALILSIFGAAGSGAGCGSNGSASAEGDASVARDSAIGADGSLPAGDGSAGAGGGGDAGDAGVIDPTQACVDYISAVCAKENECVGPAASCSLSAAACPEYFFSTGSTRTVQSLESCGSAFQALTCDQYLAGVVPPCVSPGTLPPGATCVFDSQCSSLFCISGTQSCGHCADLPTAEAGTRCGGYFTCSPGFVCDTSTGTCWLARGAGQSCTPSGTPPTLCEQGVYCLAGEDGGATGTCGTLPDAGAPCVREISRFGTSAGTCTGDYGVACVSPDAGTTDLCEAPAAEHAPCVAGQCDRSHSCAITDGSIQGTCEPLPGAGAPCLNGSCADGSYCGQAAGEAGPPSCHALVALGQACEQASPSAVVPCVTGASCTRGASGICVAASRGAPCDASTQCLQPLVCGEAGACEPVDPGSCSSNAVDGGAG